MTPRTHKRLALVLLAVLGPSARVLAQCAMCGNSFGQNDPTISAFNTSVLFMTFAPYTIFFAAVGCLVLLHRRGAFGHRADVIPLSRERAQRAAHDPKEVTP